MSYKVPASKETVTNKFTKMQENIFDWQPLPSTPSSEASVEMKNLPSWR